MLDLAEAYSETQAAVAGLVRDLSAEGLATTVPASPAWSVADVVAHVTGLASDAVAGRIPAGLDLIRALGDAEQAALRDAMTAAQVDDRRERPIGEILDEWDAELASLRPMLAGEREFPVSFPFAAAVLVTDLAVHAQDVRGALGRPGDRDSAGVSVGLVSYCGGLAIKLAAAALPALRLRYGTKERVVGHGEPAATLSGDRFELFRALSGRRSTGQILAMGWEGDPGPYVDLIPAYGPRSDAIEE